MIKSDYPLIEFNPKLPKLTQNQKKVLKLLIEAGRLVALIYLEQERQLEKDGNFYPKGVSKEEINKAAKKDPQILSPYTVIEKVNGKLTAIPYHIIYAKLLKPVADYLNQASKISDNKEFRRLLKLQAKALTEGSYEEAIIERLKMKPYILDVSIGPLEHFDNQAFFVKAAYQAWVGVVNNEGTEKLDSYKKIVLSAEREALMLGDRLNNNNKVKVKIDDVLLLSGLIARTKFVGLYLPMNLKTVEKYGSEIILFNQVNDLRLKEQILPTFKKIFSRGFRTRFTSEDLRKGSISYISLHELAHNYLNYKNADIRLQDLLPSIYELAATLLGMRIAGSLLLKDIIDNKRLESMIVAFVCRSFDLLEKSKINKSMSDGDIFINFMLQSGALRQKGGMTMPNFMRVFVSLHELSFILERLLASGTRKDAEVFIRKYNRRIVH